MQIQPVILNWRSLVILIFYSCSGLNNSNTYVKRTEIISGGQMDTQYSIEDSIEERIVDIDNNNTSKILVESQPENYSLANTLLDHIKIKNFAKKTHKGIKRERPKGNESPESEEKSVDSGEFIKPQAHFKRARKECRPNKKLRPEQTNTLLYSKELTYTTNPLNPDKKNILNLPPEILEHICSYLIFKDIIKLKNANLAFYTSITGYSTPGLIGVLHKPDLKYVLKTPTIEHNINFKLFSTQTIPSFFFYQFVRGAFNLPQAFWPYLEGTHIRTVSFLNSNGFFNMSPDKVAILDFLDYLKKTDINTINLENSGIEDVMLEEIAEKLKSTSVRNISLAQNNITGSSTINFIKKLVETEVDSINLSYLCMGCENAAKCVQALQGSKIHTICLSANSIKTSGLVSIAKDLNKTNIQTLDLSQNFTKDEGAIAFCQNLQSNKLRVLDLSKNGISAKGIAACIENMQHTSVCKLNLASNDINGLDLELIAQKLQYTHIDTVDLSHNCIKFREISKFANNLKDTNVCTVNLTGNTLYKNEKKLLKDKYPSITWIF